MPTIELIFSRSTNIPTSFILTMNRTVVSHAIFNQDNTKIERAQAQVRLEDLIESEHLVVLNKKGTSVFIYRFDPVALNELDANSEISILVEFLYTDRNSDPEKASDGDVQEEIISHLGDIRNIQRAQGLGLLPPGLESINFSDALIDDVRDAISSRDVLAIMDPNTSIFSSPVNSRPQINDTSTESPCPNSTLSLTGDNLHYGGTAGEIVAPIIGLQFDPILQHIQPIVLQQKISFTTWSNSEISFVVPQFLSSHTFYFRNENALFIEAEYAGVNEYGIRWKLHHNHRGGVSYVADFTISNQQNLTIFPEAYPINIRYNTINASELTLVIEYMGTNVIERIDLDPSSSSYIYVVPTRDEITELKIYLQTNNTCEPHGIFGRSKDIKLTIDQRIIPNLSGIEEITSVPPNQMANWSGEISADVNLSTPNTIREIRELCAFCTQQDINISPIGSRWSYTPCGLRNDSNVVVSLSNFYLNSEIPYSVDNELPNGLTYKSDIESVLNTETNFQPVGAEMPNQLKYVDAGIELQKLLCHLKCEELTLHSLGGSSGQTLAGAINTGTHGADWKLPPICDAVRAIHIVSSYGVEWWIEPNRLRVTDYQIDSRSSLNVVYDDDLFYSAMISLGRMGVIVRYVIEAIPSFILHSLSYETTWDAVKGNIIPLESMDIRSKEVIIATSGKAIVTDRARRELSEITPSSIIQKEVSDQALLLNIFGGLPFAAPLGIPALIAIFTSLLPYFGAVVIARKLDSALFNTSEQAVNNYNELESEIGMIIPSLTNGDLSRALIAVVNVIWKTGLFGISGSDLVREMENILTTQTHPPGYEKDYSAEIATGKKCLSTVLQGFRPISLLDKCDEKIDSYPPHTQVERLVRSYTYILGSNKIREYVKGLREVIANVQNGDDALIVSLSIRYTGRSRAILAREDKELNAHVEIYVFEGLLGQDLFVKEMFEYNKTWNDRNTNIVKPHLGQLFNTTNLEDEELDIPRKWLTARSKITLKRDIFGTAIGNWGTADITT